VAELLGDKIVRILWLLAFLLWCGGMAWAVSDEPPKIEAGVPRELARWRKERYRAVKYALRLVITPNAETLTGELKISVTLDGSPAPVVLDWRTNTRPGEQAAKVWGWRVNGQETDKVTERNEHLVVPQELIRTGENEIRLQFASPIGASGRAVTRYRDREDGAEYLYTLFVPSDASTAFPCFDQPDLKARFTLETTVPDGWKVIANTEAAEIAPSGNEKLYRVKFQETAPISTYVFAFAAGPFAEIGDAGEREKRRGGEEENSGQSPNPNPQSPPMRIFVRKSRLERARQEAAEIFRLNRASLHYFSGYFGHPFPFPKYDLIIVPEFAYGGMEHAGATFLREEAILFPSEPTANDLFSRAELMFHEAAHQWFGDLVTMIWFDDLWLKEGFATFMAYKAAEQLMPQYNVWKNFYQRTKPLAYLTDVTKGTTPIYQEISNLSAAKSAYGNIVYRKAPSFLRQAEFYLGPDKFQEAVRHFLLAHAQDNAEWRDLVAQFEKASGLKLDKWADAWVKRRGVARVRVDLVKLLPPKGKTPRPIPFPLRFVARQADTLDEGGHWPMRLNALIGYADGQQEKREIVFDENADSAPTIGLTRSPDQIRYVYANYQDYGYGLFPLDEKSRAYALANLSAINEDFLRALFWGSLWDSARDAELAPADYLELALKNVAAEKDEVTAQAILGRVQTAFNRYLSDEQQKIFAPRLEALLSEQMQKAATLGMRITYWRAFQAIASSDAGRATLKKMLRGEMALPGLTLRSRDKFDLITILTARGDADAPALLEAQAKADQSDDGRRYAYAATAAKPEAAVKEKYFNAYLNDKELPESWIEASFGPFNNPRQAALTLPYLETALKSLPQHKRTRKIFFVNGWLAAFVGGQCSAEAQTVVNQFLERETTLDQDLRLKILEAADGLNRCARIRAKYAAPAKPTRRKGEKSGSKQSQ
jgi:aminopeptidase N